MKLWRVTGTIYRRTRWGLEKYPLGVIVWCDRDSAESEAIKDISGLITGLKVETINDKEKTNR